MYGNGVTNCLFQLSLYKISADRWNPLVLQIHRLELGMYHIQIAADEHASRCLFPEQTVKIN